MSVIIQKKVQNEVSGTEPEPWSPEDLITEEFPIFKTDSLETIKTRYFIQNSIYPRIGNFTVLKNEEQKSAESSPIQMKIFDKIDNAKWTTIVVNLEMDQEWDVNPLENKVILVETFQEFLQKFNFDFSTKQSVEKLVNEIYVKSDGKFSWSDKEQLLFTIVFIMFVDVEGDEDFNPSIERIQEMMYEGYLGLVTIFDDSSVKAKYEQFWNDQIQNYRSSARIVKRMEEDLINLSKFIENIESYGRVDSKTRKIINTDSLVSELVQTDYMYVGTLTLELDSYELFNLLAPSNHVPYLSIGKFYKLLNNFNFPDEWVEDHIENDDQEELVIYVYGKQTFDQIYEDKKPNAIDYFKITLKQVKEHEGLFDFEMTIESNKQVGFNVEKHELVERALNVITVEQPPTNVVVKKIFGKGFFVFKQMWFPREVFFDYLTNMTELSQLLILEESYKILKERGGHRFLATINNLETSIKCSLVYKKILRPTEQEIEAFPNFVQVGDNILLVQISKAQNRAELMKLITIIIGAFSYIMNNQDGFYQYYKTYIQNINSINILEIDEEKDLKLKDIFPRMYLSGYARVCQNPPKIVTDQDEIKRELADKNSDLFLFPRGLNKDGKQYPEQAYYTCRHNSQFPYVGLNKNNLENSEEFPYLPCCFAKDQRQPNRIRYMYENDMSEVEKGYNEVVETKKVIRENQYGILPKNLLYLFNIVDQDSLLGKCRYLRLGIKQSPNSLIYCIMKAIAVTPSDENVRRVLSKIMDFSQFNFASQEKLFIEDVQKVVINKQNIDSLYFYPILENIFKINLIILCRNRTTLEDGGICDGTYNINYITNPSRQLFEKTIIIYRTMGGEFDKLKYPHHELIVKEKVEETISSRHNKIMGTIQKFFQNSGKSDKDMLGLLNSIYLSVKNIKFVDLNFKNNIVKQINDGNGKIRILYLSFRNEIINLITDPVANFYKEAFESKADIIERCPQKLVQIPYKIAYEFLKDEDADDIEEVYSPDGTVVLGLYSNISNVNVYIPIIGDDITNIKVKKYDLVNNEYLAPNKLSYSLLKDYNKFLRVSNFITSYCLFLFSNLYNDDLKIITTSSTSDTLEEDIQVVLDKFRTHIEVTSQSFEGLYGQFKRNLYLDSTNIIKNRETILIPKDNGELIKKKLLYVVYMNMKYNMEELIQYKTKRYVTDFYTTPKDFTISDNYNIYFTYRELIFTKKRMNNYKVYSSVPLKSKEVGFIGGQDTLRSAIVGYKELMDHFFFKNTSVFDDNLMIFQKCNSINHALFVSNEWNESRINKATMSNEEIDEKTTNYTLFVMDEEESFSKVDMVNSEYSPHDDLIVCVCKNPNFDQKLKREVDYQEQKRMRDPIYYAVLPY